MKCSFLCPSRRWALCLILIFAVGSLFGQDLDRSKSINLDRELEGQTTPDRAASYYHFSLGKWNEYKGDLLKALSEMQTALKYNPNSAAVHLEVADLLEKTGSTSEAIFHAQEAARLDPKDPDPHWLLANIYFKPQDTRTDPAQGMKKAIQELEALTLITPSDERVFFALGGAYFEAGEPDKAIRAFEKFQDLSPDADNGYREIAKYYDSKDQVDKAIDYLNKALQAKPDSPESLAMLGQIYSRQNKNKEAIPIYKKLLQLTGNERVSRQLVSTLIEAGQYSDAIKILNDMSKAGGADDKDNQILLGRAQIGMRDYSKAIQTFKSVLEDSRLENDKRMESQFYLALAYEQSGQNEQAAKIYSKLLQSTPANSDESKGNRLVFQQRLANVYRDMGENEKAIAIYQDIVKTDPKANPQLIDTYRVSRQFEKALGLGKQLYDKDPNDLHIAIVYARTLADSGKLKDAVDILNKQLQANPQDVDIYVNLSQIYLQAKRYSEAERVLRRAEDRKMDNETDRERVMFQRANIYEKQKDFDRAESVVKEILKTNSSNANALNYIGYMLADRGVRLEEAVQYVKEALAIDPNNGAFLDSLGWAFFKLNDLANAEKYLLQADEIVRNDATIDEHLGDLYFKTGNLQKAQEFWTKSVNIGTEQEDVQKVRHKLELLQETLRKQKSR
jgi:tetratricopeptide (TPR) repeat protein